MCETSDLCDYTGFVEDLAEIVCEMWALHILFARTAICVRLHTFCGRPRRDYA